MARRATGFSVLLVVTSRAYVKTFVDDELWKELSWFPFLIWQCYGYARAPWAATWGADAGCEYGSQRFVGALQCYIVIILLLN